MEVNLCRGEGGGGMGLVHYYVDLTTVAQLITYEPVPPKGKTLGFTTLKETAFDTLT